MGEIASIRGGECDRMVDFSMDFPGMNETMTCLVLPPRSNSQGVLGSFGGKSHFLTYSMPRFELQMGIILTLSHVLRFVLKPFGISAFVSCIVAGIILGPNGLGKFRFMREIIFPHVSQDTIYIAVMLGYNMYMFLAAVKMEVGMVFKTGRKALSIGITSTIIPVLFFSINQRVQKQSLALTPNEKSVVIIGAVASLPVVAYIIDQLRLTNTELGRLGLATGLVADMSGVFLFVSQVIRNTKSTDETLRRFISLQVYILIIVFGFRPAMIWFIKNTPNKKPINTTFLYLIMALAIGSEAYFFAIGQSQFLAPFLFGLVVPSGAPLGSALDEKFGAFTNGVLMHILVPTAFMRANLFLIFDNFSNLKRPIGILSTTLVVKMFASIMPSMILKMPINETLALAFILNYTGVVQLNISSIFRDVQKFDEETYSLVAFYILLNATIFPFIVKKLYRPSKNYESHQPRNILSMKPLTELKILTCIYEHDNVESFIKLLDVIHPTRENPIGVYALHLIELIGQYLPIMVSHSKYKPISASSSQNIIYVFNKYEQNNWNSVSVQLFTGLSSFPLMHEYICNIAMEKKTSLIIVPLHRRWSKYGYVESQDKRWRSVNCRVFEKAPCSVAIFFSRGSLGRAKNSSNISICMIFFGGNDDREGLKLAKRILTRSNAKVTVFHFIPKDCQDMDRSIDDEESKDNIYGYMYDNVMIEDITQMVATNERLAYKPHVVQDGPETIKIVRSLENQFELFIVGRRYGVPTTQTTGLSVWSELPELGIIGDYFASKDLETKASVLVVQQKQNS